MSKIQTPAMVKINKKRKGQKYGQTPLKGAWHRLVRNKMSVVGMVIIVLLLLMAIFANFIAPYSYQQQDYTAIARGQVWRIFLVRIIWEETFSADVSTAPAGHYRLACYVLLQVWLLGGPLGCWPVFAAVRSIM